MATTTFRGKGYPLTPAHPEADRYPWLDDDEIQAMADDIRANKQREPISLLPDGRILDGRNRELACYIAGEMPNYVVVEIEEDAIAAFVRSANLHRRHLTAERKRELIEDALRANPEKANNAIATELKVSDKTVAKRRAEMEATSDIPKLTATTGRDGKTRTAKPARARKPKPKKADPAPDCSREQTPPAAPEPVHPFADLMSRVTALAADLTRAVNRGDECGAKLQAVMTDCGLMDYPPNGTPRVLPLAGVHALLDLAGQPGRLPDKRNVALVYDRANGSWVPPLTKKRRERKGAGKAGAG